MPLSKSRKRPYLDRIYCVFDRDIHNSFKQAIQKLADYQLKKKKIKFFAIISTPCFEIWPLLHFKYTTQQFVQTQTNSVGDNLIKDLKNHIQDYEENVDLYGRLKEKLSAAFRNSKKLREDNKITKAENPATDVDQIVKYLINITATQT